MNLETSFRVQQLGNGYELVDGVAMHEENGDRFQIPHAVLKKHVSVGHFVELRIDSETFRSPSTRWAEGVYGDFSGKIIEKQAE